MRMRILTAPAVLCPLFRHDNKKWHGETEVFSDLFRNLVRTKDTVL